MNKQSIKTVHAMVFLLLLLNSLAAAPIRLPYDQSCPVLYDNDYANDYVDWYLMALASAGDIRYRGISTSSSIAPFNRHMPAGALDDCVALRAKIVAIGRASGLRDLPEPVAGTKGHLVKPASGKIEDTKSINSPGSRQIVREARAATAGKPLVVCVGGPLTVVADAYLLDYSIADKLVVAWLDNYRDGMYGFNGWSDGWAAYIVLEKLRLVQFTVDSNPFASVPKDRLRNELSDTPMREFMLGIKPDVVAPVGDADGPPAISIMRSDYVLEVKPVSFGGWKIVDDHEVPLFKNDPLGRAMVATKVDARIATEEWWRALKNTRQLSKQVELYRWIDFTLEAPGAATGLGRWDVEGSCTWTHEDGVTRRTSLLWYSGSDDTYVFRFGGSLPGCWTSTTRSPVAALDGLKLTVEVTPSSNPKRIGWSGQLAGKPTAWAHQRGSEGTLVQRTPILIMMPDVQRWHHNPDAMRAFVAAFSDHHGFNGGHISTIGRGWFEADSTGSLRTAPAAPDVRTFAALEAAASAWSDRGGWLHLWMWGKGDEGDFSNVPGGYNGAQSRRVNRYIAARLGPVPGWSMGIGWDVEFWIDEAKLKWWLDDLIPQLGGWHHWIGHRYSDSDIGRGRDPDPANQGEYLSRGVAWNTLRPGIEQYAGWEHWSTLTSGQAIEAGLKAVPDRPMMSEDRFRRRDGTWRQKDMRSDEDILKEIPRWASRGVAAIYGRLLHNSGAEGSDPWPNQAAIKAAISQTDK